MRARIIPTAEQFVGWVTEATRMNDGPWVEAIQRVTGNRKGDPWCASFVTFVLDMAYRGKNPLVRSASCDRLLEDARRKDWLTAIPEPGDVFLVLRTPTDAIHTGFVVRGGTRTLLTIEGNTNAGGSRDGWGVFARERARANLTFIRLPAEAPAESPAAGAA